MDDKILISKIKGLKRIQPDKQWLVFCRENLAKEIKPGFRLAEQEFNFGQGLASLLRFFGQPVAVALSIILFLTGAGLVTAKTAQNSLPGDKLYPLKIAMEKVEVRLVFNEMQKTKLEAQMDGRRAQELTDIANLPSFPQAEKEQKVRQAMDEIDKQLSATKGNIPDLKERVKVSQKDNSQKMADTAQSVMENTDKLKAAIAQAKKNLLEIPEDKALSAKISDISERLNKAYIEISEIIQSIEEMQGEVNRVENKDAEKAPATMPVLVPTE